MPWRPPSSRELDGRPRRLQRVQQGLNSKASLVQDALQGANSQRTVPGHDHTLAGFYQPDVRAALAGNGKAAPLKSLNNRRP